MTRNEQLCAYCDQREADSIDHLPSRSLFLDTRGINFIKIPACAICNRSFSLDEEFFRNFITAAGADYSVNAQSLFLTKIPRSIRRKPNLARKMLKQMELVDFYKGGIFLGKRTKLQVKKEDSGRIERLVLNKYVRGLFHHHFGVSIPSNHTVRLYWLKPGTARDLIDKVPRLYSAADVFAYGYLHAPPSYHSLWLLLFYNVPFAVYVADPKSFTENPGV